MAKADRAPPRRGADAVRLEASRGGAGLWRHRAVKLIFVVRRGQGLFDFSKR